MGRKARAKVIGDKENRIDRTILVNRTAAATGFTINDATVVVNAFINELQAGLESGHCVILKNIGVFEIRATNERIVRDPRTLAPIQMPAGRKLAFRPCYGLRKKLAGLAP